MACEIAGPEPSGLLPLGTPEKTVNRDPPTDMEDLTAKFHAAVAIIDADMLQRVQASIPLRAVACRQMHGGYFEHLL
jgi:hypothetical protein